MKLGKYVFTLAIKRSKTRSAVVNETCPRNDTMVKGQPWRLQTQEVVLFPSDGK